MSRDDDHGDLPAHAQRLLDRLDHLQQLFLPSRVGRDWHYEFAARARLLSHHLRAALLLNQSGNYISALVTLRAGLEHHLIDKLLFLGNRYVQRYGVRLADLEAEDARLTALRAGPRPDIVSWRRDEHGTMHVLIRGLYFEGSLGSGPTLSPYYGVVDQYDPFTGRADAQSELAGSFMPVGIRRTWADESRGLWSSLFVYSKLRDNLLLNGLLTRRQGIQLEVHYGFLSAYAHATKKAYELIYGHNRPSALGRFDHYASEIVLLYTIVLASEELAAFGRMSRRTPRLRLALWEQAERHIDDARRATSYFWFLSGEPQTFDRIDEVHTRMSRHREQWKVQPPDPMSLKPTAIRYYRNPLARLVALHANSRELTTGLTFVSPFRRDDAQLRR